MSTKAKIAVLEDDIDLCDSTVDYLFAKGYDVWGVNSGDCLFARLAAEPVDVLVLDVGLGEECGFDIAVALQAKADVGIIMVTAFGDIEHRVTGLTKGADTYLVKPVDLQELAANIDAVYRRLQLSGRASLRRHWQLDREHWLWIAPDQRKIKLTAKEFLVVQSLAEANGEMIRKTALAQLLNGHTQELGFNRIDVLLSRLRKKVDKTLGAPLPIRAVTARGYVMTVCCQLI